MLTSQHLLGAALGVGSIGGWFALYGLALLVTRPARPAPAPATQDLPGSEPPAVVSLLAAGWELTEDAAESTLLDLAARRYLEFRQPGDDPRQTTIHVRDPEPAGLNRYEQRVFDRVAGLAVGGVVPLTALTFRDAGAAATFEKRLRAEVVADARARGLSRRRFSAPILTALTIAAIAAGGGLAAALFWLITDQNAGDRLKAGGVAWLIGSGLLIGVAHRSIGERDTRQGRELAARWLGVRTWLQRTEAFSELPPAAVAVWDRYLSYGDALGATRVCAAVIDLGMGNRRRVWSSHGDVWHRVRVRYPSFWPRYGKTARLLIIRGLWTGGLGFLLLYFWARGVAAALADPTIQRHAAHFADLAHDAGLLVGGLLFGYGCYLLLRTIIDLATPVTRTGQVLWKQVWRSSSGGEDSPPQPWLHYLAVDDGTDDRTTAWGLPSELADRAVDGDTVRLTARRWSRRVTGLTLVSAGTGRRWQTSSGTASTEALINKAMSVPATRAPGGGDPFDADAADPGAAGPGAAGPGAAGPGAAVGGVAGMLLENLRGPAVEVRTLLTAEEVGRALGIPVTARAHGAGQAPVQTVRFHAPDGSAVLQLLAAGGMPGRVAMRARRRGQPLPGIGDEAFAGEHWVIGRRGDTVVTINVTGAGRAANPAHLHWLLATAVGRMSGAARA
jgi:Predicted membrane protein (DUF2207)